MVLGNTFPLLSSHVAARPSTCLYMSRQCMSAIVIARSVTCRYVVESPQGISPQDAHRTVYVKACQLTGQFATHRKYLNNIVEQDHRAIKRIIKPMMCLKSFYAARVVIAKVLIIETTVFFPINLYGHDILIATK